MVETVLVYTLKRAYRFLFLILFLPLVAFCSKQSAPVFDDAEFKELTENQKKTLHLSYGVQVEKLRSGYLKDAGVPEGFIILKANNQDIKSPTDMESAFRAAQASDEQTLWIWGKTPAGRPMSFAIYLGE